MWQRWISLGLAFLLSLPLVPVFRALGDRLVEAALGSVVVVQPRSESRALADIHTHTVGSLAFGMALALSDEGAPTVGVTEALGVRLRSAYIAGDLPLGAWAPETGPGGSLTSSLRGSANTTILAIDTDPPHLSRESIGVRPDFDARPSVLDGLAAPGGHVAITRAEVSKGWYSLRGLKALTFNATGNGAGAVVEFSPSLGNENAAQAAAYFAAPGTVEIHSSVSGPATIRASSFSEVLEHARDVVAARTVLAVALLADVIPLAAYMFVVTLLQMLLHAALQRLPRARRSAAKADIDFVFSISKWGGGAGYALLVAKDLFRELSQFP